MGHRVEVNFLRLLASCERLVVEDKTKRSPETRKKLQKFVGVLEKQLAALQGESENVRVLSRSVATEYEKRLTEVSSYASHQARGSHQNELRARLFELHGSHSPRLPEAEDQLAPDRNGDFSEDSSSSQPTVNDSERNTGTPTELRYRGHSRADDVDEDLPLSTRRPEKRDSLLLDQEDARKRSELMSRSESDIGGQYDAEAEQNSLTEDMLGIVSHLKNNSLSLNAILKDDASRLEELETQADNNLQKIRNENQNLQQQLKSSSSNTLWFWIIIISVALVFVWMVIFIKLFPKH